MIEPASILLETVSRVTPMGVLFCDVATGAAVSDGLAVRIRPADAPRRWQPAFPGRGGAFTAAGLPGLRELEGGAGDAAYWAGIGPDKRRPFVVEVRDRLRRFIPMTMALDLPHQGLALPECVAPEGALRAIPLYSAPARTPPPGMAAVRVELWDATRDAPASWARIELTLGGEVSIGVADDRGATLVIAPWPRIANGASGALVAAEWPVQLRAFASALPREEVPDMCTVLAQPETPVSRDPGGSEPLVPGTLQFGRELALKAFVHPSA